MSTQVTVKNIRGLQVLVEVDEYGTFKAEVEGQWYNAVTLDALVQKLQEATRQQTAKLKIDFWRWDHNKLKHGIIIGIHASNKNIIIKFDGEKAEQDSWYSHGRFLRLDPRQQEEYTKLKKQYEVLGEEIKEYEESHEFKAKEAVEQTLNKVSVA